MDRQCYLKVLLCLHALIIELQLPPSILCSRRTGTCVHKDQHALACRAGSEVCVLLFVTSVRGIIV